jgi:3-methylfumaryl-CoA hydratase
METQDFTDLQAWVGKAIEVEDVVTPRLAKSLRAMLSGHATKTPLGIHWCLAPDIADASELGPDGHPHRSGFLPPVRLPRRMWAGSDIVFKADIKEGDSVTRRSAVTKVEAKQGRTGPLVFVTVHHVYSTQHGVAVEEDHIIVYRGATGPSAPAQAAVGSVSSAAHERTVEVDPVMLFRYSALTFNGHRIHYDYPYVTDVEHYPGLVIHGPLQATLLLNFAARIADRPPRSFAFRGTYPATGPQTLTLRANPDADGGLSLEVLSAAGHLTMKATARW